MKICLDCECLLLSSCLNTFLEPFLTSKHSADFIVCDRLVLGDKPIFIIGTDLPLPFTRPQLLAALNDFERKNIHGFKNLESAIDELLSNFKKDLLKLIKDAR